MIRSFFAKARKFFGPHPYNPKLILLFAFSVYFARLIPALTNFPAGIERIQFALVAMVAAAVPSSVMALLSYFFAKYRRWSSQAFGFYLVEIAIVFYLASLTKRFVTEFLDQYFELKIDYDRMQSFNLFFAALGLCVVTLALMNQAESDIRARLARASQSVQSLEASRRNIVGADEELREQTARYLHDRVQSELVVISMILSNLNDAEATRDADAIRDAISRLERIRRVDLKMVSQILTPNLRGHGFRASVDELVHQYFSAVDFKVAVDESLFEPSSQIALGMYRIIEQAVINSISHGPAKTVVISVVPTAQKSLVLNIDDDGPGVDPKESSSGVGTAVIDSWVSILQAKKEVASAPGEGYSLSVTIPL